MYYDPEYYLEYLEKIPVRTLAQRYQLLILWQLYKPEKISSPEYREHRRSGRHTGKWQRRRITKRRNIWRATTGRRRGGKKNMTSLYKAIFKNVMPT